jgi:glutathione S-transferase
MLEFYFAPGTSSMAPHIALHEVGAPFVPRPLSFGTNEQREAPYRVINPEGKVPALVIDGRPLTEVAAILFYLARRYPEAGLLPRDDIEAEAQVVSWMSFIASTVHPARRQGLEHAKTIYKLANDRLGAREWAIGSYNLDAHYARMMTRPAVKKTIEIETALGYHLPG